MSGTSLWILIPRLSCQEVLTYSGSPLAKKHISIRGCSSFRFIWVLLNYLCKNNQTVKQDSSCASTHPLFLFDCYSTICRGVVPRDILCALWVFSCLEAWGRMSLFFLSTIRDWEKTQSGALRPEEQSCWHPANNDNWRLYLYRR